MFNPSGSGQIQRKALKLSSWSRKCWYPRPVLFPFICTTYELMQTIPVPYVCAVHNQASHLWYPFGYHSYLQSLYVQTDGVVLIVTSTGDVMVVMVIHWTWCTPKVTLPLGVQSRTVTYLLHGGTQGPWGVHGYMYMGCYTDQGFVKRLKVSICQAMILLTWATILKIFALARFAGVNPR